MIKDFIIIFGMSFCDKCELTKIVTKIIVENIVTNENFIFFYYSHPHDVIYCLKKDKYQHFF